MPITTTTLCTKIASALDANSITQFGAGNGDFYIFDNDYKYAINYAIDRIVEIITGRLGSNKFSEEALRELTQVMMFQSSAYSRVNIPDTVWTVVSVKGEPTTVPTTPTINVVAADVSQYRPDIYYLDSFDTAERIPAERFDNERGNPFSPAYALESRTLGRYGFKQMTNYNSSIEIPYDNASGAFTIGNNLTDTTSGATAVIIADTGTVLTVNFVIGVFTNNDVITDGVETADVNVPAGYPITPPREIQISPIRNKKIIGIEVVKYPTPVTVLGSIVEFPATLTDMLVNLSLLYIARKQGDQTTIFGISMNDIVQEAKNFG